MHSCPSDVTSNPELMSHPKILLDVTHTYTPLRWPPLVCPLPSPTTWWPTVPVSPCMGAEPRMALVHARTHTHTHTRHTCTHMCKSPRPVNSLEMAHPTGVHRLQGQGCEQARTHMQILPAPPVKMSPQLHQAAWAGSFSHIPGVASTAPSPSFSPPQPGLLTVTAAAWTHARAHTHSTPHLCRSARTKPMPSRSSCRLGRAQGEGTGRSQSCRKCPRGPLSSQLTKGHCHFPLLCVRGHA